MINGKLVFRALFIVDSIKRPDNLLFYFNPVLGRSGFVTASSFADRVNNNMAVLSFNSENITW